MPRTTGNLAMTRRRIRTTALVSFFLCLSIPKATLAEENVTQCRSLPSPTSGACDFTPGEGRLLIRADLLLPGEVLVNGEILVGDDGRIACAAWPKKRAAISPASRRCRWAS